jgi:hypothetical protein
MTIGRCRPAGLALAALFVVTASACSKSNPAQPTTASVAAPQLVSPGNGTQLKNTDQPVTLTVANAVATQGTTTYTFEVALDAGFTSKVQIKSGITEGSGGQTTVKLDALAAAQDYYWHVRADGGGTTGIFGTTFKFSVGPAITLNPPTLITPANGAVTTGWPAFTVLNATRSGTNAAITYRFEIATNSAFTGIVLSQTQSEGAGQTTFAPPVLFTAPPQNSLVWRVTALDQTDGLSAVSATQSFTYSAPTTQAILASQEGLALWPGQVPPGTNGHSALGDNWGVQRLLSVNGVAFVSPPLDALQVFDCMDRGMDPQAAIDWMHGHGYPGGGAYFPDVDVIGFQFIYLSRNPGGRWDLVIKTE